MMGVLFKEFAYFACEQLALIGQQKRLVSNKKLKVVYEFG
jgi:hypothetical protein